MFRVGHADETLPTRGITHLVEHLTSYGARGGTYDRNAANCLSRALFRTLREDRGLSYVARATYSPRDGRDTHVLALADAQPGRQDAVAAGVVDILAELAAGRIVDTDLEAIRAARDAAFDRSNAEAARLVTEARDVLLGRTRRSTEELRAELRAITVDTLRTLARQAHSTGLVEVPEGTTVQSPSCTPLVSPVEQPVSGTRYPSVRQRHGHVVVGPEGVTMSTPVGELTLRFAACAGVLAWSDGGRRMIAEDGTGLQIEPVMWQHGQAAIAAIDKAVPTSLVIRMPERPQPVFRP